MLTSSPSSSDANADQQLQQLRWRVLPIMLTITHTHKHQPRSLLAVPTHEQLHARWSDLKHDLKEHLLPHAQMLKHSYVDAAVVQLP
jgi:hypothetical protein